MKHVKSILLIVLLFLSASQAIRRKSPPEHVIPLDQDTVPVDKLTFDPTTATYWLSVFRKCLHAAVIPIWCYFKIFRRQ